MMTDVATTPVPVGDLDDVVRVFLEKNMLLGADPGDDAAAIYVQCLDGRFAPIAGAACPNNQRRAFPGMLKAAGLDKMVLLAGAAVLFVAPNPLGGVGFGVNEKVVWIGWDRRTGPVGELCASAQGGVGGGQTFEDGACSELMGELYVMGVVDGHVVRVVPEGTAERMLRVEEEGVDGESRPLALSADNPFGVPIVRLVEAGRLMPVGYHYYSEGGYLTAVHTWDFPGVLGMMPILPGAAGTYGLAWQDAVIPVQGRADKKVGVRIQGALTGFPYGPLLEGVPLDQVPSVMVSMGSQGFMPLLGQVGEGTRPPFHPTVQAWATAIAT
jgi:hypothetical protein